MEKQRINQILLTDDVQAFEQLTALHRSELVVHCYRMLGSALDAEDMVQETLLRAWKNLERYTEAGNFRAWLYKIATNVCLDELRRTKQKRSLIQPNTPVTHSPYPNNPPLEEAYWLEPFADHLLPTEQLDPEAAYTLQESVHLAFMTALHALSPRYRAILILRDVLDWKAHEVADYLELTESAVNSALLRARKALEDAKVDQYRHHHNAAWIEEYFQRYIEAWETKDISKLLVILKEDVIMNMPPFPTWYQGRESLQAFLAAAFFSGSDVERWRTQSVGINGQQGLAFYIRLTPNDRYTLVGLHVLTIVEDGIARIDYFVVDARPMLAAPFPAPWLSSFNLPQSL